MESDFEMRASDLEEPPEKTFGFYDIPRFQHGIMVFEEPGFFGCQIGL